MLDFIKEWTIIIVITVLIASLLEILSPEGPVKKITGLLAGLITVVAIINPLLSIAGNPEKLKELLNGSNDLLNSYETSYKAEKKSDNHEFEVKSLVLAYKTKIKNELVKELNKQENIKYVVVEAVINENYQSNDFGRVERIMVELEKDSRPYDEEGENFENTSEESLDESIRKSVSARIIDLTGIDQAQIIINIK